MSKDIYIKITIEDSEYTAMTHTVEKILTEKELVQFIINDLKEITFAENALNISCYIV